MSSWTAIAQNNAVDDAASERAEPLDPAVGALGPVAERRTKEPPERIAAEADRDECKQQMRRTADARRYGARPAGS